MKRLFILLGLILSCVPTTFAQKLTSGSLIPVFNNGKLNVEIDYSQATICGLKEATLLNIGGELAEDWEKGKPQFYVSFVSALASRTDSFLSVGKYDDAEYTLILIPSSIEKNGEIVAKANIVGPDGEIVAVIDKIKQNGDKWNSFVNLLCEELQFAGWFTGDLFSYEYRPIRKQLKEEELKQQKEHKEQERKNKKKKTDSKK